MDDYEDDERADGEEDDSEEDVAEGERESQMPPEAADNFYRRKFIVFQLSRRIPDAITKPPK